MSNIQGKVVLITGASSGIGEAAARLIAAKCLTAHARQEAASKETAGAAVCSASRHR